MKKYIIALLAVAAAVPAAAQDNIMMGRRAELRNVAVAQSGDTVRIEFDVQADGKELRRKEGLVIIPLVNGIELPRIIVSGPRHARVYKREQALAGRKNRDPKPGLSLRVSPGRTATGHYRQVFVLTPEMMSKGATLELESYVEMCCSETSRQVRNMLGEPLRAQMEVKERSSIEVSGMVTWLEPAEEKVKRRETSATAHLTYPQGVTRVMHDYGDNASELARMDRIFSPLVSDKAYAVRSVRIDGYASIEGRWNTNDKLARARAEDFRRWIGERYRGIGRITVNSHSEDWDGLVEMIRADMQMPYRYEALAVIESYGIFGGREKHLMDLGQGVPYKYMYRWFFPKLRRMVVTFEYEVDALDGAGAEKVMASRPGDLSHAEMLRTLRQQKMDALTMYRRVAAQHPDDPVALINASSAEMVAGNIDEAWAYLQQVQGDPRAANNMKVYRLLSANEKPAGPHRYKIATE
jgi:outer membrane protein OmpA-like peptidoglycan-associated protein